MGDLNDDRFHDLLKLIGDQRRDFQAFEASVLRSQAEHWKSVTIAIRTLSDWWVKHADEETAERKTRQAELNHTLAAIQYNQRLFVRVAVVACLVAVGIVVGYFLL